MELLQSIRQKAKELNKTIVLPEGEEERTIKAAEIILKEGLAKLILLGNEEKIRSSGKRASTAQDFSIRQKRILQSMPKVFMKLAKIRV